MTEHPVTLVCGMSGGGTRLGVELCRQLGIDFGPRLDYSLEDDVLKWPVVRAAAECGWDKCLSRADELQTVMKRFSFPTTSRPTGFKTPAQTAVLPLMLRVIPRVRVVYVARHPVPLCYKERPYRTLRMKGAIEKDAPYRTTAREYQQVHDQAMRYLSFHEVPTVVVRVEDIYRDPAVEGRRVAAFLGLEPVEAPLGLSRDRLTKVNDKINETVASDIWNEAGFAARRWFGYERDDYKL